MKDFVLELINGQLTSAGYVQYLKYIHFQVTRNNWPLFIVEEISFLESEKLWNKERFLSFAQQFMFYILKSRKILYLKNISEGARYTYLTMILSSYVSDIIKFRQKKEGGISYATVKKTILSFLKLDNIKFKKCQIDERFYWCLSDFENSPPKRQEEVEELIKILPKIDLFKPDKMGGIKKYKNRIIRERVFDILQFIESPIEESYLLDLVFNSFVSLTRKEIFKASQEILKLDVSLELSDKSDYDNSIINIMNQLDDKDIKILKHYFFNQKELSLRKASEQMSIKKSTIDNRTKKINKIIRATFNPLSEKDAQLFLENFKQSLDNC